MASGRLSPSRLSSSNISALLSDDPSAVGAHFEELLSAAIVVLEGEDDHVLFASAAALALTGHTREDVFNLYTFSACFEGDSSASSVAEVLAGREAEAVECRLCTKAGQPFYAPQLRRRRALALGSGRSVAALGQRRRRFPPRVELVGRRAPPGAARHPAAVRPRLVAAAAAAALRRRHAAPTVLAW